MGKVVVVTDSTAYIPPEMLADLEIEIIPLNVIFGEETLLDGVDILPDEFYCVPGPEIRQVFRFGTDLAVFEDLSVVECSRATVRHRDPIIVKTFLRVQVRAEMPLPDQPA